MKTFRTAAFWAVVMLALSGCGLYIHDATLQESAEKTRTLVSESDLSKQITDQIANTQALAKRQESAVMAFFLMKRNQQLFELVQPDILEPGAFGDGQREKRGYISTASGFARDPVDFKSDLRLVIDCRLDTLLKTGDTISECFDADPTRRDAATYDKLRKEAAPELEYSNLRGVILRADTARQDFVDELKAERAANNVTTNDPRLSYSCERIPPEDLKEAQTVIHGAETARSHHLYHSFVLNCDTAQLALEMSMLAFAPADPVLPVEQQPPTATAPASILGDIAQQIEDLQAERAALKAQGSKLAADLDAIEAEIKQAKGPGPLQDSLIKKIEAFKKDLGLSNGLARLIGLNRLENVTTELLQIELTDSAQQSSSAATAAAGTPTKTPEEESEIAKRGEAILRVAGAAAAAIDAYSGAAPSARAQSLIIARAVINQKTEVAKLEADLLDTKLRLLRVQRRLFVDEAGQLAQAGAQLNHEHLTKEAPRGTLGHIAAAWDEGRLRAEIIPYRIQQAERETAIRISGANARHLQASVLAAVDQIVAYSKGGITREAAADIVAKFFIGAALL